MIAAGIVIHWAWSDEYLEVNLGDLNALNNITHSVEWWRHEKRWVKYNVHSNIKRLPNGSVELALYYDKHSNTDINPSDSCWGKSSITLTKCAESGYAVWDDYDNSDNNGQCNWDRIKTGLITPGPKPILRTTKLQREQARFRSALLMYEDRCVLTGETTSAALEAAHIIPSKDRGTEVVQNGIILRSDIHRLYDSEKFLIDPSGCIVNINGVSPMYQELLNGTRLRTETVKRVREALQHQWDKKQDSTHTAR
jgi:hypothetical protein